jgi:hypothetical protein
LHVSKLKLRKISLSTNKFNISIPFLIIKKYLFPKKKKKILPS